MADKHADQHADRHAGGAPAPDEAGRPGVDRPAGAVDWEALRAAARNAMARAYAPYSRFRVGAAGLVDDGRVVVGCNVENAAYGVALCAECGMVSALHAGAEPGRRGRLVAVTCVGPDGELLMPCGRCRQLLWENGGPDMVLDTARGLRSMREVLPDAFGAEDLEDAGSPVDQEALVVDPHRQTRS